MVSYDEGDYNNSQNAYYNEYEDDINKISALNLERTIGFNFQLHDAIHNLKNSERSEIFYPIAHTGVIYDYENNTQRLLQGHCNQITCTAYCKSQDILVTADKGPDSMLVVWDVKTGTPRKTILDPHPDGCEALDITPNGDYIVTLSRTKAKGTDKQDNSLQSITLWEWAADEPMKITTEVDPQLTDYQFYIRFNTSKPEEFASTGKSRVCFWLWQDSEKGFDFYSPYRSNKQLTQTVFLPGSSQVVTGTMDGFIIVWDISLLMEDYTQPDERRAIKQVNLMNTTKKQDLNKNQKNQKSTALQSKDSKNKGPCAINILKIEGDYLVIGCSNGSIRFYDQRFRIKAWFENIDIGSITNISFANDDQFEQSQFGKSEDEGENAEGQEKGFACQDFIVVDKEAKITKLESKLFETIEKDMKKGTVLLQSITSPIKSISVRPKHDIIAIQCDNSILYEWNFKEKDKILQQLNKDHDSYKYQEQACCIDYSPDGNFLALAVIAGKEGGKIHIYQCENKQWQTSQLFVTVSDAEKHKSSKPVIIQQVFSDDSKHLATMDTDYGVSLFAIDHILFDRKKPKEWQFVGKCRVHQAPITSISFGTTYENDVRNLKLFSISEDMRMAEYDVIEIDYDKKEQSSMYVDRLKLLNVFQIEQECVPTACIWYPINQKNEDILMTVNSEYKTKLWSIQKNDPIKICKKTCLGPTYGGPINKLLILNPNDSQNDYQDKYLAYATKHKIVGIIKLPLDGNPNQTMGLIAHPGQITGISSTNDGKYFFTSGSEDFAVLQWRVNTQALEQTFYVDPDPKGDPYPKLLEGGPDGPTHRDLKDFFYYSQIRSKDENTTKARKLDGLVPLIAIPDMMRSMGYYPSKKEIENMKDEIKYSKQHGGDQNNETVEELDTNMFLKLFVNHRPVYGIGKDQVEEALQTIQNFYSQRDKTNNEQLTDEQLVECLMTYQEKLTDEEVKESFKILLGEGIQMPKKINSDVMCNQILGFEDPDEEEEIYDEPNDEVVEQ